VRSLPFFHPTMRLPYDLQGQLGSGDSGFVLNPSASGGNFRYISNWWIAIKTTSWWKWNCADWSTHWLLNFESAFAGWCFFEGHRVFFRLIMSFSWPPRRCGFSVWLGISSKASNIEFCRNIQNNAVSSLIQNVKSWTWWVRVWCGGSVGWRLNASKQVSV
jgi:hypothetical protein